MIHETRRSAAAATLNRARALDRELALSRIGGDLELLHEIALLLLSDSGRMLDEIHKAVATHNAGALDRAAHTLKGCVSNFGAQSLYEAALALERMGRSGDLSTVGPAYQQLRTELLQLETDLRELTAEA